ncbi:hypothetical protein CAL29_12535 [Bordetella genomosp. 10]|uniref:HTH araC/xylS-type domain-containing protein n=1 Tax=Bordetella genomosp. 10 TaxID=1416804 RepID=A0A261SAB4_9BORD|nr:helix-turn-helix domain-containing protein [Bordetella genomosp. 10]OZI34348.1 hypothetical protein CAL29_12535 [Bordetella genomosp. 10]
MEKHDSSPSPEQTRLPKAVLDPTRAQARFRLDRYPPSAPLVPFVDYHWVVQWDLADRSPEIQRVLPYPNAHLVFDPGKTALFGVMRGVFDREIKGCGRAIGVRFRCGGLRPFLREPVAAITDRVVSTRMILDQAPLEAEEIVLRGATDREMVQAAEALLLPRLPEPDPMVDRIAGMMAIAAREGGPTSVEQFVREVDCSLRGLQRLFHDYVGVPPKWVVQRFRIQEAAWRLSEGYPGALSDLATELGYFDQAHLALDFARFVGCSPSEYRQRQRKP